MTALLQARSCRYHTTSSGPEVLRKLLRGRHLASDVVEKTAEVRANQRNCDDDGERNQRSDQPVLNGCNTLFGIDSEPSRDISRNRFHDVSPILSSASISVRSGPRHTGTNPFTSGAVRH